MYVVLHTLDGLPTTPWGVLVLRNTHVGIFTDLSVTVFFAEGEEGEKCAAAEMAHR